MNASQIRRGYLAIKLVPLPMAKAADGGNGGEPAPEVLVGLRPLRPGDEAEIYGRANAFAKAHGAATVQEADELYEYGKAIWRCLLGVVDADSPRDNPAPFFDGGVEQIKAMTELGKDGILSLAEQHQAYTDEISGLVAELQTKDGYAEATKELAGPNGARFFFSLRPGLRVSWALSTARLLATSLQDKSPSFSQ
jgi:hypothetical protein